MGKKILIIDDDPSILDAMSMLLKDEGYVVSTTTNGGATREKVESFLPDIIILDVLISGFDGRDICADLKANEGTKNIPIIMISAHPTARESTLACGADDFLAKPFEIDHLLETVKRHLV